MKSISSDKNKQIITTSREFVKAVSNSFLALYLYIFSQYIYSGVPR